jgi:O-antigen ligase
VTGRRLEIGALLALAFFLPLYEAPKSIFWALYVLVWVVNRLRARDFGGPWDSWDTLIGLWVVSGFVVAAFAGLQGSEWRGAIDLFRYGTVAWCLKRTEYSVRERRWVFAMLVFSAVAGLALAHWRVWVEGAEFLELNSVGHVNHTAIYVAIMLGVCVTWLYGRASVLALVIVVLMLVSLTMSASRAGIGVALMMVIVIAAAWWPRSRQPLGMALALVGTTVVIAYFGGAEVIRKHQRNVEDKNILAYRDGIWRAAVVTWQRFPLFGIGMDNYAMVKLERVKAWREEAGKTFEAKDYSQYPHAHSIYFNTLAERGVAGTVPLGALLTAWLIALWRRRPKRESPDDGWLWWSGAAAAWMITTGVGLVNTTLHHEHGILAALFLGMWLSATSSGRSSAPS